MSPRSLKTELRQNDHWIAIDPGGTNIREARIGHVAAGFNTLSGK